MTSLKGKVAVITGAGSGIGRELALQLADLGCSVAIADIHKEGIEETAGILRNAGKKFSLHLLDVSRQDNVYNFADDVIAHHGKTDILINNAGVALQGNIEDTSYENLQWILGINTWGAVYATKAFLPHLKKQPEAFLVNISSLLGLVGAPTQSGYCMSKFAIRGFTEAVRMDIKLAGLPITVISVHPGSIKTNIARFSRIEKIDNRQKEKYVNRFEKSAKMSSGDAAQIIIKGIMKKKQRILVGTDVKFADFIQRLMPATYDRFILSSAKKMRKIK